MFKSAAVFALVFVATPLAAQRRPPVRASARRPVVPPTTWTGVSAGSSFTCALDQTGQGYCWGENVNHKLGIADSASIRRPTAIETPQRFQSITAGYIEACGVTREGAAVCWGGAMQQGTMPRSAMAGTRFKTIELADGGCGITADFTALCWGSNSQGQLGSGRGTTSPSSAPEPVSSAEHFQVIAVSSISRCALTPRGAAMCWGGGPIGGHNLGATAVVGNRVFSSIAVDDHHACALAPDGTAYCWGEAEGGALGTGRTVNEGQPAAVASTMKFKAITVGMKFSCAIGLDAKAYCWGANDHGELGNGTLRSSATPAPVSGTQTFTAISAGTSHVCAIGTDGSLWCWGDNADGELGTARSQSCGPRGNVRPCSMVPAKVQDPVTAR